MKGILTWKSIHRAEAESEDQLRDRRFPLLSMCRHRYHPAGGQQRAEPGQVPMRLPGRCLRPPVLHPRPGRHLPHPQSSRVAGAPPDPPSRVPRRSRRRPPHRGFMQELSVLSRSTPLHRRQPFPRPEYLNHPLALLISFPAVYLLVFFFLLLFIYFSKNYRSGADPVARFFFVLVAEFVGLPQ